ncbi:nucleotide pyrophosphohydrolase [Allofustis seminis]|uniref:nucleotide pyrophosphohydrolase n=1 Tax=Allofustis seminis TaxID=166939 RepID=UPI00058F3B73|nr:nucleotide pyrophosphohydrolase [Allofustis seminis]
MIGGIHLEIKEMQRQVDEYIQQFKVGYFEPLALLARITEEVGELSREINHFYGSKPKKSTEDYKTIDEELADVLFTVICMANALDIDLESAFLSTMDKFKVRDKNRFERVKKEESE